MKRIVGRGRSGLRVACVVAGAAMVLSAAGCGEKLEQPYSFEERGFSVGEALSQAAMSQTASSQTDLSQADLSQTNLSQAASSQADLSQAPMSQVDLSQTSMSQADWGAARGYGEFFASNLCVVMDESQFSQDELGAEAGALFSLSDGSVLYSKNAFERLYPASITKIMTALLAIKYGNLSDMVTVTEDSVITESGASLCGIRPGDRLSLEQLLYGLMLPSGNDAGAAIAVHMAGSVEAFADMMNEEARSLGAVGTHFVNPHGLTDENHYTTAYDLYLIFQEALKLPKFCQVTGTTSYEAEYVDISGAPVKKTWNCTNQYLIGKRETPSGLVVFSGKTGTTSAAGSCLIIASKEEDSGDEFISVILKAPNRNSLYENMTMLLEKATN